MKTVCLLYAPNAMLTTVDIKGSKLTPIHVVGDENSDLKIYLRFSLSTHLKMWHDVSPQLKEHVDESLGNGLKSTIQAATKHLDLEVSKFEELGKFLILTEDDFPNPKRITRGDVVKTIAKYLSYM